ncbi:hypothetical protein Ancab_033208 [Ancistrocladus abbreviatus]
MEDQNKDDLGSLFEGMVLFTPSEIVDNDDAGVDSDPVPSIKDSNATIAPPSLSSSEPLDENLFSDLTVIAPLQAEAVGPSMQPHLSPVSTSTTKLEGEATSTASVSRQVSRKKKRASLRIGYGRDVQISDDHLPLSNSQESVPLNEKLVAEAHVPTELSAEAERNQDLSLSSTTASASYPQRSEQVHSEPSQHEAEPGDTSLKDTAVSSYEQMNVDVSLKSTPENDVDSASSQVEEGATNHKKEEKEVEEKGTADNLEIKYEQIKAEISEKLRLAKELAASISAARKECGRRRRKAYENVNLASLRYRELEKKLEEACEAEDFEMAESLSESLAAAEKEKVHLLNELRDAEAECDAIDSKMQEALECQIATEEESVSLLQHFFEAAASNANVVLENAEVNSSKEMDEWFSSFEALQVKKMELEVQSHLVNEARSGLNNSIDHLVENDIREKEYLCEKKKLLAEELDRLLTLVREKEAEIAENDSKIEAVDKRIAEVASGFEDIRSGIVAKSENLQHGLSEVEFQNEALSKKQNEIDDFFSQEKARGTELKKLATISADLAKAHEQNLVLRKSLMSSVLKSREEKAMLARIEEKILADIQLLREEISAARASLQELSSRKLSVQQEIESSKQRMFFIDKRIPELEAEKKVAAASRNFKEAARISAEAKTLSTEKESELRKMEEGIVELGTLEEEIKATAAKMQETEGMILLKEKEAALARFQRLRLVASAALAERSAALELDDLKEANILLAEAEASESEAKQLQSVHGISDEDSENRPTHFISMDLVSSLDGAQLAELATSCGHQFPSDGQ